MADPKSIGSEPSATQPSDPKEASEKPRMRLDVPAANRIILSGLGLSKNLALSKKVSHINLLYLASGFDMGRPFHPPHILPLRWKSPLHPPPNPPRPPKLRRRKGKASRLPRSISNQPFDEHTICRQWTGFRGLESVAKEWIEIVRDM